jgi:UDP-N-acetyl-D-mannosaminuronic acid dehydrogenase
LGGDIHLAHSPERILPGNVFEEIVTNDRIIGGFSDTGRKLAAKLYEPFLEGEIYYTDLTSAELCKLMENTFRDVNVGLANEFALIGDKLGVDVSDVIELANRHPRVDILSPGIGVGGHCLPVDPWFLNEVDPEHTHIVTTARRINDTMPAIVAREIRHTVAGYTDPRILALGISYKPNTYDQRNSPAKKVVEELRLDGYDIVHRDPHVEGSSYDDFTELLTTEDPDVVVQLVPHDQVVAELSDHADLLAERGIEVLQPGSGNPLDPA